MSVPVWVSELAGIFWKRARQAETFPRVLRRPSARGFQFSVVLLPELTIRAATKWLMRCGIVCEVPGQNRLLRACLVARWGHGVAILDGDQSDDELRFSLAHELAHFLKDYWSLRMEVQRRLGAAALEVNHLCNAVYGDSLAALVEQSYVAAGAHHRYYAGRSHRIQ